MGHLSNEASAVVLSEILHSDLKGVVLAHLSEMNNRPDLALAKTGEVINHYRDGVSVTVAGMSEPTPVFRLDLE